MEQLVQRQTAGGQLLLSMHTLPPVHAWYPDWSTHVVGSGRVSSMLASALRPPASDTWVSSSGVQLRNPGCSCAVF